ncbi:hypothetical protein NHYGZSKF_CDS0167 [Staphylococcus phage PG-2021_15]
MLENEFKQILDKRKEQLESKTTFDSPDWFQWFAYIFEMPYIRNELGKAKEQEREAGEQKEKLYRKRERLEDIPFYVTFISFWLLVVNSVLCAILSFKGVSIVIPMIILVVSLIVVILSVTKTTDKVIDKALGYSDNHNYKLYACKTKVYKKYYDLHKLYYVNGEYYRKWYIEYILGLDAREFVREDEFSRLIMDTVKGNYVDGSHLYDNKYHTVVDIIESGMTEREHWVNSLPTTRFLTYKEFITIEETSSLVKSVKETDKYITQFEDYMKNKDKLNKERYGE